MPADRNTFAMVFLPLWLVAWAFGAASALKQIWPGAGEPQGFLVFWLIGWALGGGFAAWVWLWMLAGRERIVLRPRVLLIRREVFGLGWGREYELAKVRNLRIAASAEDAFDGSSTGRYWWFGGGTIAFDYGPSTVRFAEAVAEPEATQIIRELKARHHFPG